MKRYLILLLLIVLTACNGSLTDPAKPTTVFFLGDSHSWQGVASHDSTYPEQALRMLGSRFRKVQAGYPGRRSRWFLENKLDSLAAVVEATPNAVCVVWFGSNDVANFGVAQAPDVPNLDAFAHTMRSICDKLRERGAKVLVVSVMNRLDAIPNQQMNADRLAANAYYQQHYGEFADGYVNLSGIAQLYMAQAPSNPRYFLDLVHPTATGYGLVAEQAASAIKVVVNKH